MNPLNILGELLSRNSPGNDETTQARIQDFAQGGATAKKGHEARGPNVSPIITQKVCGFVPVFFSWDPFIFYIYYLILSYCTAQGGASAPLPSPLPGYVPETTMPLLSCGHSPAHYGRHMGVHYEDR